MAEHQTASTSNPDFTDSFQLRKKNVEGQGGSIEVTYLTCVALEEAGFVNAFSTRLGGVSPLPSNALNLSAFKGDVEQNVVENRRRFLAAIDAQGWPIITARQTHSVDRVVINSSSDSDKPPE